MKRIIRSLAEIILVSSVCLAAKAGCYLFPVMEAADGQTEYEAEEKGSVGQIDTEHLTYFGLEEFSVSLPVVYIDTDGRQIERENKVWASVGISYADPEAEEKNIMEGPDTLEAATIKMRGASSYLFNKKQYRLKFYTEQGAGKAKEYSFLGMGADSEWVLNGPFLDKTLVRNRLLYELAGEIFEWAPHTRYCELFLNGRYQGVYLAVEPVTVGQSRLDLSRYSLMSGETAWLVKRDRIGTEEKPIRSYGEVNGKVQNSLYIDYPSKKKITDIQRGWIEQDISRLEYCLYGDRSGYPLPDYVNYIDMDNFVDYFIFNEAAMNHDAGNLSTYVYKDLQGTMKMAVWDYNNAYDNYQWFETPADEWYVIDNSWFSQLVRDRAFLDRVMERYGQLRQNILSEEHIYALIDAYQEEMGEAVERNFAVWGYTFDDSFMNDEERELHSYEEAVKQLKRTIHERFVFMDTHLEDLYENCAPASQ